MKKLLFLFSFFLLFILQGCDDDKYANEPPKKQPKINCWITKPYPMQVYQIGEDVLVEIKVEVQVGELTELKLSLDDNLIETKNKPPFVFKISSLSEGLYKLKATAIHSKGMQSSSEVTISIGIPLAELTTHNVNDITLESALSGGEVLSEGLFPVTERGICWDTVPHPTINHKKISEGRGVGSFEILMNGLKSGTTYYVRAYAISKYGAVYGDEKVFSTVEEFPNNGLPEVITLENPVIDLCHVIVEGEVVSQGCDVITERGFCWSTQPEPTTQGSKNSVGTGIGIYTSTLKDLKSSTLYYLRAYAVNACGTSYGAEISFTSQASPPFYMPNIVSVSVSGGTFLIGSPSTECERFGDEEQHQVTLSAFLMSKNEITYDQFDAFCDATCRTKPLDVSGRGSKPVANVSWDDAVAFCEWYSGFTGEIWRLPTDAEWEYACRGGTTTPFYTGACISGTDGNITRSAQQTSEPCSSYFCGGQYFPSGTVSVGSYSSNAYGLNDMQGNVMEWCSDWYAYFKVGAETNPTGPSTGQTKVVRGGGYNSIGVKTYRSAKRTGMSPTHKEPAIGFRVVKEN